MKNTLNRKSSSAIFEQKLFFVTIFFSLLFAVVAYRLVDLHLLKNEVLTAKSDKQYFRTVSIQSYRGTIYDRNRNILAINLKCQSLYAVPYEIEDPKASAKKLASALNMTTAEGIKLLSHFESTYKFRWIKRKMKPEDVEVVKALKIKGLHFAKETKRFYPKRDLAASVIGFVGIDNQGLYGVENQLDDLLQGEKRNIRLMTDAKGRSVEVNHQQSLERPGYLEGAEVTLTIEPSIQYRAEKSLEDMVLETSAKTGMAIVMDVETGEILASAEYPRFNPNKINSQDRNSWGSNAAGYAFEPGSILKPIAIAAGINEKLIDPETIINCENGRYRVSRMLIREAMNHRYGNLSVRDVLAHSSNIGTIKIASMLKGETFYRYLKDFGINNDFDLEIGGENIGLLAPYSKWSDSTQVAVSFGQELSTNMFQLAAAYGVIANGGYLLRPTVIKEVQADGEVQPHHRQVLKKVISEETASTMRTMLKYVVDEGTGKKAAIDGYDIAGKTGSAQKYDPITKKYFQGNDKMVASFAGFLPAHDPKVVIIVAVDEPKTKYWGGSVAAPVFKDIAQQVINYYGIPSNNPGDQLVL